MKPLHKDDIEILDNLLKELFKHEQIEKGNEFKRFLFILQEWDVIKYNLSGSTKDGIFLRSNGVITERFINDGGFKHMYKIQQEKEKINKTIEKGNIATAKISILTYKTFWWTLGIAITGWIISILQYIKCH